MSKIYPVVDDHDKASCFQCGADLDGTQWSESGYAQNRGAYVQDCSKCGWRTWYDVRKAVVDAGLVP